jgi:hypothetical protein
VNTSGAEGRTTVIQITNTGNMADQTRCFYVTPSATGCAETDFDLFLTKQQPTSFVVASGRGMQSTPGLSPGLIPPVQPGFIGALICAEVGPDGAPLNMNQLKGEATIISADSPDESGYSPDQSKYDALAVQGLKPNNNDDILNLDGTEYNNCPATTIVDFQPFGATDPIIEALGNGGICSDNAAPCNNSSQCNSGATCDTGQSTVASVLSLVPCNLDLENGIATKVTLQVKAWDEYEVYRSTALSFSCVGNIDLTKIPQLLSSNFLPDAQFVTMQLTPSVGGPVLGVLESTYADSVGNAAGTAANLQVEGAGAAAQITVPSEQ